MGATEVVKLAKRSCGTCRERRVLCDRTTPTCQQCTRSKRHCKGYGLRLSWPNAGDGRRAVVVKNGMHRHGTVPASDSHLVHISQWDVQMHYYLTASSSNKNRPVLRIPMVWNPCLLEIGSKDLLHYFNNCASLSLTTFGQDPKELGNLLMRIAVVGDSPSSIAVLKSLLALSSLHRYGVQSQALELKISSLKALTAASNSELGDRELIQHVATGMLLCSFEVHQASCTSSQWTWYIAGVKKVLNAVPKDFQRNSDMATLMDWVYYHDVLARFTLRHWQHDGQKLPMNNISSVWSEVCTQVTDDRIFCASSSTLSTLELLSEVCDTVAARPHDTMSIQDLDDYKGFLRVLDWRIRSVPLGGGKNSYHDPDMATIVELYQLAILVYLNRVSGNLLDQSSRTQQHLDRAYGMFAKLDSCERQFPIFILGCEARTDEQRTVILDLIARTEKKSSSRSLNHIRILILALWAQDDLADREINYWDKMTAIISRCSILPSLV